MRTAILFCLSALMVGCATQGSVEKEPLSAGATRKFNADFKTTVDAARGAIGDVGLNLKSEKDQTDGVILMADRGVTAWSYGEIVRVFVQPVHAGATVRVLTERVLAPNPTSKDFAEDVFTRIGERLGEYP